MRFLTHGIGICCLTLLCAVMVAPAFAQYHLKANSSSTDNVTNSRDEVNVLDRTPHAGSQTDNLDAVLYDNGPLSTGDTTKSGVVAPAGSTWSEVQNPLNDTTQSNALAGIVGSITPLGRFRIADDFTVPAGTIWTIDSVATFAYQTGSTPTTSPFIFLDMQIWSGRPGDAGSVVVGGDTTTNRLGRSTWSTYYRILNTKYPVPGSSPGTTRPVYWNVSPMGGLVLGPGTYWVDWQTQTTGSVQNFTPLVTVVGQRGNAAWNGRQWTTPWQDALDPGNPLTAPDSLQDIPFVIYGRGSVTIVDPIGSSVPQVVTLNQNYPNPFNPNSTISYQIPAVSYVELKVYDVLGHEVATLVDGVEAPGFKSVRFHASALASGVYLYRLRVGAFVDTKTLVLLR